MARVISPLKFKGKIGDLILTGTKGGTDRAYLRSHFNKKKWRSNPRALVSRENAIEFGGAAKCGSAIYKAIRAQHVAHFMPYAHNHIAKRIRRYADRSSGFARHFGFEAALPALKGLDLSHKESATKQITMLPIGPVHAPTAIRITGLQAAAQTIARDTANLQCRIITKTAFFPTVQFEADGFQWRALNTAHSTEQSETLWIPIDLIPEKGLQVNLPAQKENSEVPRLHWTFIEWRQVHPKRNSASYQRKPSLLIQQTIIRLSATTITPEQAAQLKNHIPAPQPRQQDPKRYRLNNKHKAVHPARKKLKSTYPTLFLAIALMG